MMLDIVEASRDWLYEFFDKGKRPIELWTYPARKSSGMAAARKAAEDRADKVDIVFLPSRNCEHFCIERLDRSPEGRALLEHAIDQYGADARDT